MQRHGAKRQARDFGSAAKSARNSRHFDFPAHACIIYFIALLLLYHRIGPFSDKSHLVGLLSTLEREREKEEVKA
jgi:hypothetical protein